jgi:hypothetical protein
MNIKMERKNDTYPVTIKKWIDYQIIEGGALNEEYSRR